MGDLVVSGIRANLDVLGPSDLPKLPDVDGAKERLVCERRKNTAPNIGGKVDDALNAIWIHDAKAKSCKRFDFDWSVHMERMTRPFLSARRESLNFLLYDWRIFPVV